LNIKKLTEKRKQKRHALQRKRAANVFPCEKN
jgi:hypothetical protein